MEYQTLVGPIEEVDEKMNLLAKEGWSVHTHSCVTMLESGGGLMPIFSILMQRIPFVSEEETKPKREFIGRG